MNPRLLEYYNQELQHIRESAAEFAEEFPKIAGRLSRPASSAPTPTSSACWKASPISPRGSS